MSVALVRGILDVGFDVSGTGLGILDMGLHVGGTGLGILDVGLDVSSESVPFTLSRAFVSIVKATRITNDFLVVLKATIGTLNSLA